LFFAGLRLPNSGVILKGGIIFWMNVIYSYLFLLVGAIVLLKRFYNTRGVYHTQAGIVLAGLCIPWANSIIFLLGLSPFSNADNTPFSFSLAGMAFVFALIRYHLLDIVPIARDTLIEDMIDGVLVIDCNHRIVDANPMAEKILGRPDRPFLGTAIEHILADSPEILQAIYSEQDTRIEEHRTSVFYFDVHITQLFDKQQHRIGQLLVWHDISKFKQIQADLEKLATQDSLTQIYNRRHFYTLAQIEMARTVRLKASCAFVLVDLDYFKQINDTYGHQAGDQALITFTKICQHNLRSIDILARLGGEEFIFLLPTTNQHQAYETVERIRIIINQTKIHFDQYSFSISASFGISIFERPLEETLDSLLSKADQALYYAKYLGRNRVVMWEEHLAPAHSSPLT
jgi:diguanylate cyclase (GGDEF)-like protein/PAS domain S-box-containing protein